MAATSKSWCHTAGSTSYLTSTNPSLLSHSFIQSAFAHKDMYWAKPLPEADMSKLLSSSLNLGLYIINSGHAAPSPTSTMPPPRSISEPSSPRDESPTVELSDPVDEVEYAGEYGSSTDEGTRAGAEEGQDLEQIGFARFITDHVTTFYLTDVFIAPSHRGKGLGKWLVRCTQDVLKEAPFMRRALLMASPGQGERFYENELGMYDIIEEKHVVCMTRRKYDKDVEKTAS